MDWISLIEKIKRSKKRLISIEGAIGVGKSTLGNDIDLLLKKYDVDSKFYPEPYNKRMLREQFIPNMPKYAYAFQLYMLTRRQLDYNEAYRERDTTVSLLDRSLTGDYAFMSLQKKRENVSDDEFDIYCEEYYKFEKYKPDTVIYLNVNVDIMKERIATRNRPGEESYDFEYLEELQKQYMEILPNHIPSSNLIIVDWNNDVLVDGHVKEDVLFALLQQIYTET